MPMGIGDMVVNLSANTRQFDRSMIGSKDNLKDFNKSIESAGRTVASFGVAMAAAGVAAAGFATVWAVKLGANAEVMRTELQTLLGDLDRGTAMFKELESFAIRTSFDLESAAGSATQLLSTGVGEAEILSTMQLLGDLAQGDSNKLALVGKAYTDVLSKGKLQAQELRQFAENGINIRKALMDMLGKSSEEITKMSESGAISFETMQSALQALTAEGGVFFNAMENRNKTMIGQWDALKETVQGFGRDLGEMMLPTLKAIVEEANKFAQGFREIEDKGAVIGELLSASIELGIEHIKVSWANMLVEMVKQSGTAALGIAKRFTLVGQFDMLADFVGAGVDIGKAANKTEGIKGAEDRLAAVRAKIAGAGVAQFVDQGPQPQNQRVMGQALTDAATDLFGVLGDAISSPLADAKTLFQEKMTEGITTFDWLKNTAANLFANDSKKTKPLSEASQAASKGSMEAVRIALSGITKTKDDKMLKVQQDELKIQKDMLELQKQQAKHGDVEELVANF